MDGCTRVGAFRRILFPLASGAHRNRGVLLHHRLERFLYADVIMQQQAHWTLPVWLFGFQTNTLTDYGGLMAACTLFALPVVVFFLIVQRRLVSGLTAGAVKG